MNRTAAIALMLSASFAVSAPAFAQEQKATIPFSFSANDGTLPAGTYVIQSKIPQVLTLRNIDTRAAVMALGMPTNANGGNRNVLVFHRYGDQYFLSGISSRDAMNYVFSPSKTEKEAQAQMRVANSLASRTVFVALK